MNEGPLLRALLPAFADRLEAGLRAQGESRLADQVAGLRVTAACKCDQQSCGSFHTLRTPMKRWFIRGRQVELTDGGPGQVVVDVVRGEIAYVEVLDVDGVRDTLAALPSG